MVRSVVTLEASVRTRVGGLAIDSSLTVEGGQMVALLGPNGAGKTSLLRAIAGLIPTEGRVVVDSDVLHDSKTGVSVPTDRRPIGFVFQDYLLFPHLNVLENIAFGLRARRATRASARSIARSWIEHVGLGSHAEARPRELSGGQAQRVALARALAIGPKLLLLDEPLAALDARARAEVRHDLKHHLSSFDGTRLLVTHDPLDAVVLAERLLIMEGGRIVQAGTMDELRAHPRSFYVADLVGINLYQGTARGDQVDLDSSGTLVVPNAGRGRVFVVIHPRAVALHKERPEGSPRNVWTGRIAALDAEGGRVRARMAGLIPVVAEVTPGAVDALELRRGDEVWVSVKATEVTVYPD
jgi:molybdate transport system ATP-binding protein